MQDALVRKFLRAAQQRFTSAETLWENNLFLDSIYLAGYTPECAFKALLLSRVPAGQRLQFFSDHFRGAGAHDYDYLAGLLRQRGVVLPLEIVDALRRIRLWSTDLRYEPGAGDPQEAQQFLASARAILEWVQRSV